MTLKSGEMVCTTKSGCPGDELTSSEIVASPPRPHVGQLRTKAITGMGAIRAVWTNGSLDRLFKIRSPCPMFVLGDGVPDNA